jgi:hypothetical protein
VEKIWLAREAPPEKCCRDRGRHLDALDAVRVLRRVGVGFALAAIGHLVGAKGSSIAFLRRQRGPPERVQRRLLHLIMPHAERMLRIGSGEARTATNKVTSNACRELD